MPKDTPNYEAYDSATLEQISRKHEGKAALLMSRGDKQGAQASADEAKAVNDEIQKRADAFSDVRDPEGTAPTLSDGLGNFADSPAQANAGGIGIRDSNSKSPEAVAEEIAQLHADLAEANRQRDEALAKLGAPGTNATSLTNPVAAAALAPVATTTEGSATIAGAKPAEAAKATETEKADAKAAEAAKANDTAKTAAKTTTTSTATK